MKPIYFEAEVMAKNQPKQCIRKNGRVWNRFVVSLSVLGDEVLKYADVTVSSTQYAALQEGMKISAQAHLACFKPWLDRNGNNRYLIEMYLDNFTIIEKPALNESPAEHEEEDCSSDNTVEDMKRMFAEFIKTYKRN